MVATTALDVDEVGVAGDQGVGHARAERQLAPGLLVLGAPGVEEPTVTPEAPGAAGPSSPG